MRAPIPALAALLLAACGGPPEQAAPDPDSVRAAAVRDSVQLAAELATVDTALAPALDVDLAAMERRPSGLYVRDRRVGRGALADSGKWVTVDYTTWLADGSVLDGTRDEGGEPQRILLGYGRIIEGWEEGITGMREGGRRTLVVPPSLAYGKAGRPGSVPERATLVFDIELRKVH